MGTGPEQISRKYGSRQGKRIRRELNVGCWNMRTLVEAEGAIETSVVRPSGKGVTTDRKVALMVGEF